MTAPAAGEDALPAGEYCRRVEAYLCRKNGGHLIRIVGPSFERVAGWAGLGIPLKVAFQGIDRACERHEQKGRRTRPIHIDFCEADVLEAYASWRRAVGPSVAAAPGGSEGDEAVASRRRPSLAAHIDRALVRLSSFLAAQSVSGELRRVVEQVAQELDGLRSGARGLRGDARRRVVDRLAELDRLLGERALACAPDSVIDEGRRTAREQLAPLRDRMTDGAYDEAVRRISEREVRARLSLPTLAFD